MTKEQINNYGHLLETTHPLGVAQAMNQAGLTKKQFYELCEAVNFYTDPKADRQIDQILWGKTNTQVLDKFFSKV